MTLKERWVSSKFSDKVIFLDFSIALFFGIGIGLGTSRVLAGCSAFLGYFLLIGEFEKISIRIINTILGSFFLLIVLVAIYDNFWLSTLGGFTRWITGFLVGALLLAIRCIKQ